MQNLEKRIIIKEVDKLFSVTHKDKYISEFIIYLMIGETRIEAYNELGEDAKKIRVNELLLTNFIPSELGTFLPIEEHKIINKNKTHGKTKPTNISILS